MRNVAEALTLLGSHIGLSRLALDSRGSCTLTVNDNVKILFQGNPDDDVMQISGVVGSLNVASGPALARVLLELNFDAGQNGPAAFAADPATSEVLLTQQLQIGRMTPEELHKTVENFVGRVEFWSRYLPRLAGPDEPPDEQGPGNPHLRC